MRTTFILPGIVTTLLAVEMIGLVPAMAFGEPQINAQFPVRESGELSPPIVAPPIHECAAAVYVYGFVPGATVRVLANGTEVVGNAMPEVGFAEISLTRPLTLSDVITATQTVGTITSAPSYDPVPVGPYPALTTP